MPAVCGSAHAVLHSRHSVHCRRYRLTRSVACLQYFDSRKDSEKNVRRSKLDLGGFSLIDCPTRNTKETLDKKIIVDGGSPTAPPREPAAPPYHQRMAPLEICNRTHASACSRVCVAFGTQLCTSRGVRWRGACSPSSA